jgi:hypothetical protein
LNHDIVDGESHDLDCSRGLSDPDVASGSFNIEEVFNEAGNGVARDSGLHYVVLPALTVGNVGRIMSLLFRDIFPASIQRHIAAI